MLSKKEMEEIQGEIEILPDRRSACIEALKAVQRHRRWVSDEAITDIAEFLGMPNAEVDSVATFYNLVFRHPVGRNVILLCDSVSCWIMGCRALGEALCERLGTELGGTTSDERFTVLPIACLGVCERAPALMVNEDLHREVRIEAIDAILRRYE